MRRAACSHVIAGRPAWSGGGQLVGPSNGVVDAAAMESTSNGSTSTAAPPATSSVEVAALVTTGVPCTIASSTGSPKPSNSLG